MYVEVKLAADQLKPCLDIDRPAQPSGLLHGTDPFEKLHDSVLLQIFNRVGDIKALGRCILVSKRFCALAPLVENVTVKVDCVITGEESGLNVRARGFFGYLFRFMVGSLVKPLQVLQHMLGPKKAVLADVSHHSPGEVLKNFKAIQNLRIELPGGELGVEDGVLLKWKAEFGSTLENCVILGAAGLVKPEAEREKTAGKFEFGRPWFLQGRHEDRLPVVGNSMGLPSQEDSGSLPESFYTNDGQGMLCMGREQLQEFRNKPIAASASANRTQVPALNMKLWYAPYLELPGGTGLNGATLVVIKPIDQPVRKEVDGFVSAAFEEPYQAAVSLLAKRRTYLLEMNSF